MAEFYLLACTLKINKTKESKIFYAEIHPH